MLLKVNELKGELVLVIGTMNAGKSEDLIETIGKLMHSRWKDSFMVFANSRNTRDGAGKIASGSGLSLNDVFVADAENPSSIHTTIARKEVGTTKQVIIFDEGNMYTHKFVPVVERLRDEGRAVIVYGLDLDFRGNHFGPMGRLQEIAGARESITGKILVHRKEAYCCVIGEDEKQCKNPAGFNLRLKEAEEGDKEIKYFDEKGNIISGFAKAPFFGPTIMVEGSLEGLGYTTACQECFGALPKNDLVARVLAYVQRNDGCSYDSIGNEFGRERDLPEVLAYTFEERKLDINAGTYSANTNSDHPTWEEATKLAVLGKALDKRKENTVIEVYRMIKEGRGVKREEVMDRFGDKPGIERILSGLMMVNFIKLKDATFVQTPYILDIASGMYVPKDIANQ